MNCCCAFLLTQLEAPEQRQRKCGAGLARGPVSDRSDDAARDRGEFDFAKPRAFSCQVLESVAKCSRITTRGGLAQ